MEENVYYCRFYRYLTADISVLLVHPCTVTTIAWLYYAVYMHVLAVKKGLYPERIFESLNSTGKCLGPVNLQNRRKGARSVKRESRAKGRAQKTITPVRILLFKLFRHSNILLLLLRGGEDSLCTTTTKYERGYHTYIADKRESSPPRSYNSKCVYCNH